MNTWTLFLFVNLIGHITCPTNVETGSSEGSPLVANPPLAHPSPPIPPAHSSSGTPVHDPSQHHESNPHHSQPENIPNPHHLPTEGTNHSKSYPKPAKQTSSIPSTEEINKIVLTGLDTIAMQIMKVGNDLKSRVFGSEYGPHLQRFGDASNKFEKAFFATARQKLAALTTDPKKATTLDKTDHTAEMMTNVSELFDALKGMGGVYTKNNFGNIQQALPKIKDSGSSAEAKRHFASALEKDMTKWGENLPNPTALASTIQTKFTRKGSQKTIDESGKNSMSEKEKKEFEEHHLKSDYLPPHTEHGNGASHDGKQSHTYTKGDTRTDEKRADDKKPEDEIPKPEPSKTIFGRIIDGILTVFPIHEWIWHG